MLIGLTGKKRRGKNTVANYLSSAYGFNLHGFADKVKEYAYAINPLIPVSVMSLEFQEFAVDSIEKGWLVRLQDVVNLIGWEQAKEIPEVRQLLQRTGTEGGRRIFSPLCPNETFWIELLFAQLDKAYDYYTTGLDGHKELQSNVVIYDVRFDNEAERIKERGGYIIKVVSERAGLPEPDAHVSEQDIHPKLVDIIVHNDGTIDELYGNVAEAMTRLRHIAVTAL